MSIENPDQTPKRDVNTSFQEFLPDAEIDSMTQLYHTFRHSKELTELHRESLFYLLNGKIVSNLQKSEELKNSPFSATILLGEGEEPNYKGRNIVFITFPKRKPHLQDEPLRIRTKLDLLAEHGTLGDSFDIANFLREHGAQIEREPDIPYLIRTFYETNSMVRHERAVRKNKEHSTAQDIAEFRTKVIMERILSRETAGITPRELNLQIGFSRSFNSKYPEIKYVVTEKRNTKLAPLYTVTPPPERLNHELGESYRQQLQQILGGGPNKKIVYDFEE